jgi:hypothetical protein
MNPDTITPKLASPPLAIPTKSYILGTEMVLDRVSPRLIDKKRIGKPIHEQWCPATPPATPCSRGIVHDVADTISRHNRYKRYKGNEEESGS